MFNQFEKISLEDLNAHAPLMNRRDSKYLLSTNQLKGFLTSVEGAFQILEINGCHQFNYCTHYLDTPNHDFYIDHNKGRRKRYKIRFREYVDSGLYYFEIKLKGVRGITHKYRKPVNLLTFQRGVMTAELSSFVNEKLQLHYQRCLSDFLDLKLSVQYRRVTLVSKTGMERITIDNYIRFTNRAMDFKINPNIWIVEVKSETGFSDANKIMYRQKARPIPRFSKYCVGVSLTSDSSNVNRFRSVVKRIYSLSRGSELHYD